MPVAALHLISRYSGTDPELACLTADAGAVALVEPGEGGGAVLASRQRTDGRRHRDFWCEFPACRSFWGMDIEGRGRIRAHQYHENLMFPSIDFDRTAEKLGPFGSTGLTRDHSTIQNGTCAIDSAFYADDQVMRLGQCVLSIFDQNVEGQFMWTVRNELEPRWNYISSYDKGWIKPQNDVVINQ